MRFDINGGHDQNHKQRQSIFQQNAAMLSNENHYGKSNGDMRTRKSAGRFFAGKLQKTHCFTEKVSIGNVVERRTEIELRSDDRKDGKNEVTQIKRPHKHKYRPVEQFHIVEIAPKRYSENDEIIGKITEIHQLAKPSPRHSFAKFEARLATKP